MIQHVSDAQNPILQPFVRLMQSNHGQKDESLFVAEGRILIETLTRSKISFEAILVSEVHSNLISTELKDIATKSWVVVPTSLLHHVAGFRFHGGMIGFGLKPKTLSLTEIMNKNGLAIVVCSSIGNLDNLGLILRSAKAFGYSCVVITEGSGDPFSRRCLRLSMGASMTIPIVKTEDLVRDLNTLKSDKFSIFGAVITPQATPFHEISPSENFAIVLGNEAEGLSHEVQDLCTAHVRIPMIPSQDSLNVAVAGGILMQHFGRNLL